MTDEVGASSRRPETTLRPRRLSWWLLISLALITLLLIPVPPIFLPRMTAPEPVDVIFVLGPAQDSRLELAERLIDEGFSENLVISVSTTDPKLREADLALCSTPQVYSVRCMRSDPFTTQGEIGLLEVLARKNGWQSAIVVTFAPHVSRTQLYLDRCFTGSALVLADQSTLTAADAVYQYVYQTGAFVKSTLVTPGCV